MTTLFSSGAPVRTMLHCITYCINEPAPHKGILFASAPTTCLCTSIAPPETEPAGDQTVVYLVSSFLRMPGHWRLIQRRVSNNVSFERNWTSYVSGFGNEDDNFWLGLEKMHVLTLNHPAELQVELEAFNNETAIAHYSQFAVGDLASGYKLSVSGYSGTAGDAMTYNNGCKFSTYDRDDTPNSCAERYKSGWWHLMCTFANLNGEYVVEAGSGPNQGVYWDRWKQRENLRKVEMFLSVY